MAVQTASESSKSTSFLDWALPRNPVTQERELRLVPESVELAIGSSVYGRMLACEGGHAANNKYAAMVQDIGKRLSAVSHRSDLPFEFSVIDSATVNAWCLPGGKIAFYTGLIEAMDKETGDFGLGVNFTLEEKIAAVMGHELTHATARHGARTLEFGALLSVGMFSLQIALKSFISREEAKGDNSPERKKELLALARFADAIFSVFYNLIKAMIVSCSGRRKELEADKYGMVNLQRAGYDPRAAIWLQHFFASKDPLPTNTALRWLRQTFSTHPHGTERAAANIETLKLIEVGELK
jgi:predicted Zn-dependent protease